MLASLLITPLFSQMPDPAMKDFAFEPAPIYRAAPLAPPIPLSRRDEKLKVLSYNIRHCAGTDDRLDLARTAKAIGGLNPDFVGLQEVDNRAGRSGSVNQAEQLGKTLGMDSAFGAFMDFDGGQYGLAVLSRFPIRSAKALRLPTGNEPRVALFAEIVLPSGRTVTLVNLHFDWVKDDGFRFAQASHLAGALDSIKTPFILLGDFNDQPGSRTLKLFQDLAVEAKKPPSNRLTFSSIKPEVEIDFIFAAPAEKWRAGAGKAVDLPIVSDHRPVLAELTLKR